jgi:hypothetical protein
MAKMMNPELEAVRFENEDVIATSLVYDEATGTWTENGRDVTSLVKGDTTKYQYNIDYHDTESGHYGSTTADSWNGGSAHWVWDSQRGYYVRLQ